MYSLILSDEARNEWMDAAIYYELQSKGLGERFSDLVQKTLDGICANPKHYQKKKNDYREARVKPFPFNLIFRIDKKADSIIILAVFHTKRNPRAKYQRE